MKLDGNPDIKLWILVFNIDSGGMLVSNTVTSEFYSNYMEVPGQGCCRAAGICLIPERNCTSLVLKLLNTFACERNLLKVA